MPFGKRSESDRGKGAEKVTVPFFRCFPEDFAQGDVVPAGATVPAFAGALVVARTQACPGGTMVTVREHADVGAEFDEDRAGAGTVDPGDGHQ